MESFLSQNSSNECGSKRPKSTLSYIFIVFGEHLVIMVNINTVFKLINGSTANNMLCAWLVEFDKPILN